MQQRSFKQIISEETSLNKYTRINCRSVTDNHRKHEKMQNINTLDYLFSKK